MYILIGLTRDKTNPVIEGLGQYEDWDRLVAARVEHGGNYDELKWFKNE